MVDEKTREKNDIPLNGLYQFMLVVCLSYKAEGRRTESLYLIIRVSNGRFNSAPLRNDDLLNLTVVKSGTIVKKVEDID